MERNGNTAKTAGDILYKLGVIPDDEGINILTTWKESICKKQREICAGKFQKAQSLHSAGYTLILNAPEPT